MVAALYGRVSDQHLHRLLDAMALIEDALRQVLCVQMCIPLV